MSEIYRINGRIALLFVSVAFMGISLLAGIDPVIAYEHGSRHREFLDARHSHNHYYPARGGYVDVLPRGHRIMVSGRERYFFSGGVWYRPWGSRFVVVAPPVGLVIPVLPPYYTVVRFSGVPYYYANDVYYMQTPDGYTVVIPPQGTATTTQAAPPSMPPPPAAEKTFIYPRQGQNEKQQATDRYECHRWAVGQTGYDPTQPPVSLSSEALLRQQHGDYQRAQAACLDGRGYTVK